MSKHSEGPWRHNAGLIFTESRPSRVVCELSEPEPGKWLEHKSIDLGSPNWDEAMANGELLKAAPQMAEALVGLLEAMAKIPILAVGAETQTHLMYKMLAAEDALKAAGVQHA